MVAAASSLFRRRGIDGVGIDDLMAEAGLTRGGFYGQFGSKDALAGEACSHAFDAAADGFRVVADGPPADRLERMASRYLSDPIALCPMATLAGDAARAPVGGPLRKAFTAGLRRLADMLGDTRTDDAALSTIAALVGASVLRRASDDGALSDAIDAAVLRQAASWSVRENHGKAS